MNILLIHPAHSNSKEDRLDPPLGLLYIGARLQHLGINVEVLDLSGTSTYTIPKADIYGITSYISTLQETKRIALECKIVNPQARVVIGGAHATIRPYDFDYADHVVSGAGETALVYLAAGQKEGKIIRGDRSVFLEELPAYNLIDIQSYKRTIAGKKSLPYLTSRGCVFNCAFCGLTAMHKTIGFKLSSSEIVQQHLIQIKESFGIDRIAFQDDIFTFNKERLFKMLNLIKPLNIKFRCMGRAGYDTEEVYARLAEAGCVQVSWGIESGSQTILDRMNKHVTVENNYRVIQWAKKYGITSRAFFIIGFPGETEDTLEETLYFIERADPDQYFVSNFIPYPGTAVALNPNHYGILSMTLDYNQYYQVSKDGTGGLTIDTEWLTKEQFRLLELNFRSYLCKHKPMRGELQTYEK